MKASPSFAWSTRFPDLEGIETGHTGNWYAFRRGSTRFPDLEGIETPVEGLPCLVHPGRPGSLIWKGLRLEERPDVGQSRLEVDQVP